MLHLKGFPLFPKYLLLRLFTISLFATSLYTAFAAIPAYTTIEHFTFTNPTKQQRYYQLINELRCPKCQNQSIADSDSLIAKDLRKAVFTQMKAGKSNQQIIDFMVQRFGEFILYKPSLNKTTAFLWFGPIFILLIGAIWVYRQIRHYRKLQLHNDSLRR